MLVQAGALAMVAVGQDFGIWLAAAVLLGVGTAMVYATLLAAIVDVVHPNWRARSVGTYRFWRDSGFAAGLRAGRANTVRPGCCWRSRSMARVPSPCRRRPSVTSMKSIASPSAASGPRRRDPEADDRPRSSGRLSRRPGEAVEEVRGGGNDNFVGLPAGLGEVLRCLKR